MKISVVIPIYNGEKSIMETIESVINQPFKDIEVVCIDDGSLDQSGLIVKKIAKYDNRIRYFYKKNEGVHSARNLGIQVATGKYLFFLDQDDLWISGSIDDSFVNKIENDNCDFYMCSYYDVDESVSRCKKHILEDTIVTDVKSREMHHHSSYVFSTSFLRKNKIFTDEYRCEDWRFLMRCYTYAEKVETMATPFFLYRNNPISVTHTSKINKAIESSIKGFVQLSETTDDLFLKETSTIWAIGMIFELIDEFCLNKKAKKDIVQICSFYKLDDLVRQHWASDKNKRKYTLIKNHINIYILWTKLWTKFKRYIYSLSRFSVIKKVYYKKKYPEVYG